MQIEGLFLEVGQRFWTIDGLGGLVTQILPKKKGWRHVTVEGVETPYCIFDKEILDLEQ